MAIKKTSKRKTKYHLRHSKKTKRNKSKSHKSNNKKNNRKQRGGAGCGSIASVKEPGFEIAGIGSISGLSIPESRATIYKPNCQKDTYQAMVPN